MNYWSGYMRFFTLSLVSLLLIAGCIGNSSNDNYSDILKEDFLGVWRTGCIEKNIKPVSGHYYQEEIELENTDYIAKTISYADSECADYEYDISRNPESYYFGEYITSESGLPVYEIDWEVWLGDVYVTDYQIITIIDDKLYIGESIHSGGSRATKLRFDIAYVRQ